MSPDSEHDEQLREALEQFAQDLKSNTLQFLEILNEIVPMIHALLEPNSVEALTKDHEQKVLEKYNRIKEKKMHLEQREEAMNQFLRFVSEYLGQQEQ
jgi:hypothetical protein